MSEQRDRIAARAYDLWERRGRPVGSPEVDWLAAEREIRAQTSDAEAPNAALAGQQQKQTDALTGGGRQAPGRATPATSAAPVLPPKSRVGRNGTQNTPR
jgi:hypothetical protein